MKITLLTLWVSFAFSVTSAYAEDDAHALHRKSIELNLKANQTNIQAQELSLKGSELNAKAADTEKEASIRDLKSNQLVAECFQFETDTQALRLKRFDTPGNATALDNQIDESSKKSSSCWTKVQKLRFDSQVLQVEIAQTRADAAKMSLDALKAFFTANQLRNDADDANSKANSLDQKTIKK